MLSALAAILAARQAIFTGAFTPPRPGDPDVLRSQLSQARPLRQGHHRDQASLRHEVRVINQTSHGSSPAHATIAP